MAGSWTSWGESGKARAAHVSTPEKQFPAVGVHGHWAQPVVIGVATRTRVGPNAGARRAARKVPVCLVFRHRLSARRIQHGTQAGLQTHAPFVLTPRGLAIVNETKY